MLDRFPPMEMFEQMPDVGRKYSLSEKWNPRGYHSYVSSDPVWRAFHGWIKGRSFVDTVDRALRSQHIDLGLEKRWPSRGKRAQRFARGLARGRLAWRPPLSARFEFSALPADGGCVIPHTDAQKKLITLVVSMARPGEWNPSWGGGTDVNRPTDTCHAFNWVNNQVPFEQVEVVHTYPFAPNQCLVFIKTFNSLHSVRRMTATGNPAFRKTLTINIEEDL